MRKIDGRKAEIVDCGRWFDTYKSFAMKYGYPDAAAEWKEDTRTRLKDGDIVTLLVSGEHESIKSYGTLWIVEAANGERHIFNEKGLRILETASIADQLASLIAITDGLTETVGKLALKVTELEKHVKVADSDVNVDEPKRKELTRDDVIECAKADVVGITEDLFYRDKWRGTEYDTPGHMRVEFVVNRGKRTVVALVYGKYVSSGVYARGIAKAAPGDVFNTHIGRAIALRRALGLEVPAEYTNAPQPSEPRVGDIVNSNSFLGVVRLVDKARGCGGVYNTDDGTLELGVFRSLGGTKIIDDSREEVAV